MKKIIIYIIIAVAVLGIAGGVYYLFFAGESLKDQLSKEPELFGDINFALAGIDDFEELNLGSIDLGLDSFDFGGFDFNSIASDSSVDLSTPVVGSLDVNSADLTINESSLTSSTPSTPPASEPPASTPPAQTGPTVDASTCAQFSSVPSCSYVSDTQGRALCQQCKDAGY